MKFNDMASRAGLRRGIWALLTVVLISAPDLIMDTLVWLLSHALEALHLAYELIEFLLDEGIHHLFHTDRHSTQVIVFYLMLALYTSLGYVTVKRATVVFHKTRQSSRLFWQRQRTEWREYWRESSWRQKIKWLLGVFSGAAVLYLGLF
ncbi:MAG: hypothetical protein RQ715_02455 [Methylococcales bacterium]|nr:hypothetical protein [Methylococcales bacterium]